MQIFVRTLDDRTLTLNVQSDDTINEIKEIVEQREGIPVDEQRLTLGGISLDDELTVNECHIEEESTLYVLLDLEGGGKKRKKKNYSTPKKNKHKRKKVKLAVLKYYKVKKEFFLFFRIKLIVLFRLKIPAKSVV
jgi:small subunit ribosomal protein S27Ae